MRFPPGSLAALEHVRRGFVPHGAPSLPVHPTQLYEAALGLVAAALAAVPLARGRRDGRAFSVFLAVYAAGRFAIEFLRGDRDRGGALGLSTAQWVSLAIGVALASAWARRLARARRDGRLRGTAKKPPHAQPPGGREQGGGADRDGESLFVRGLHADPDQQPHAG